ncbi:hypothetical protein FACS189452_07220 [Bacteroidia bacterium]|nr:hypothetical protein FACS189452_07220 [Bacteroidia bacterium]
MNETLINRLTELFALIAAKSRVAVADAQQAFLQFMEQHDINEEQTAPYVRLLTDELQQLSSDTQHLINSGVNTGVFFIEKLVGISDKINHEMEQSQKMWLVLQCVDFVSVMHITDSENLTFIRRFAAMMRVSDAEFDNVQHFLVGAEKDIPRNDHLLLVASQNPYEDTPVRFLPNEKILGKVYILYIESNGMLLVRYFGQRMLFLNGRNFVSGKPYIFGVGGVIRNPHITPIYYNKVLEQFTQIAVNQSISYVARNVSYRFKGSKNGIHPFSFHARSGELVAVMGGSGVGKSTLLNLLSGQLKPRTGQICINGNDIRTEKENVESVIGYVPQDDLLVEELTVYENLYYNALLCFKDYTEQQIADVVKKTIEQFDLVEATHFKVGSPLKKFISGGQRKRLNMAMELMRQPSVLFVDEPTSGLSSIDSEKVMLLLKKQALQGKIVIINIHQPSSDLYKLFNRVMVLDHGGYVIYQGNPMDAMVYFKEAGHFVDSQESECNTCGNVNTDLILRVVEARAVNEYGRLTRKRKHSAAEWYRRYMLKINPRIWSDIPAPTPLPQSNFKQPKHLKQLLIFFLRNFKSKLANRQYMLLTLLEAPLLALVLGYFTKFAAGTESNPQQYIFAENSNIPSYIFICVIATFFFGLTASAQEIIKDRKILQRERLLHLSRNSYLLSKALWLCIVSAVQTLAFVLVGNFILEIHGLTLPYFALLFSTSVCANMIGLNLSSALNSDASIYIFIPLILVPQILFSGVIVQYEKLHRSRISNTQVPVVAALTPARWTYEALAVTQFKDNKYEQQFFEYDEKLSHLSYVANLWIPQISINLATAQRDVNARLDDAYTQGRLLLLRNELPQLQRCAALFGMALPSTEALNFNDLNNDYTAQLQQILDSLKLRVQAEHRRVAVQKDEHSKALITKLGGAQALLQLQKDYHNNALADMLQNKNDVDKIIEINHHLFQAKDPVFLAPASQWGRAHFYAAHKKLLGKKIDTLYFNTAVLWLMSIIFYLALYFDWLRKGVQRINKIRLRQVAKHFARAIPN